MKTIIIKLTTELPDDFGITKEQEIMRARIDVDFEDEETLKTEIKQNNENILKMLTVVRPDDPATIVSDNLTFARIHFEESDDNFTVYYDAKE